MRRRQRRVATASVVGLEAGVTPVGAFGVTLVMVSLPELVAAICVLKDILSIYLFADIAASLRFERRHGQYRM